jgi:hypothetical protein
MFPPAWWKSTRKDGVEGCSPRSRAIVVVCREKTGLRGDGSKALTTEVAHSSTKAIRGIKIVRCGRWGCVSAHV